MKKRFILYGADVNEPSRLALKIGLNYKLLSKVGFFEPEYIFEVDGDDFKITLFKKILDEACEYFENGPFINSVRAVLEEVQIARV